MSWRAIILAAGESRRMGEPKALLDFNGDTFADRLIGTFRSCSVEVSVVVGADAERIATQMARRVECSLVVNPNPEVGQLSSLQCGLRAAPGDSEGFFVIPVDCPGVRSTTIQLLQRAGGDSFVVPRYGGRRGHPVGFRSRIAAEFLGLDPARETARTVVHRHRDTTVYVDVDDPAILWDIDDRQEYLRTFRSVLP
ncbi:MAG: nucleotidyltransferase family protein [Bryobacterales bacterium]|nr:nucleotidyltransferase family protein [Bryobacterales bacterium]